MPQPIPTLRWEGDINGHLVLLDQTRLPNEVVELHCHAVEGVWHAIKRLAVRGAPAIGVAAAYGVCLSWTSSGPLPLEGTGLPSTGNPKLPERRQMCEASGEGVGSGRPAPSPLPNPPHQGEGTGGTNVDRLLAACDYLATSRPTAVNLFYALNRMRNVAACGLAPEQLSQALLAEARAIHAEDAAMCAAIGQHGSDLLADLPVGAGILTHCNAGSLATAGDGTALSVIFELARRGKRPHIWVDETRPLLQGARLTAWELTQRGIDCTLITDSMAAQVMREGRVQAVITGADRIAANGDSANKIGTYSVAVLAKAHDIPFYIAAPSSTFDPATATGADISIEQRAPEEVTHLGWHALRSAEGRGESASGPTTPVEDSGRATPNRIAPQGVKVYNPAFDVTPAHLIRAIITENGAKRFK